MQKLIKFNIEMFDAIAEGRKAQTRRVLQVQPSEGYLPRLRRNKAGNIVCMEWKDHPNPITISGLGMDICKFPYGRVGERIIGICKEKDPKLALNLIITSIRVERLNDISEEDCIAEGIWWTNIESQSYSPEACATKQQEFEGLWELLKGKGSWSANPYVWVISFKSMNNNN